MHLLFKNLPFNSSELLSAHNTVVEFLALIELSFLVLSAATVVAVSFTSRTRTVQVTKRVSTSAVCADGVEECLACQLATATSMPIQESQSEEMAETCSEGSETTDTLSDSDYTRPSNSSISHDSQTQSALSKLYQRLIHSGKYLMALRIPTFNINLYRPSKTCSIVQLEEPVGPVSPVTESKGVQTSLSLEVVTSSEDSPETGTQQTIVEQPMSEFVPQSPIIHQEPEDTLESVPHSSVTVETPTDIPESAHQFTASVQSYEDPLESTPATSSIVHDVAEMADASIDTASGVTQTEIQYILPRPWAMRTPDIQYTSSPILLREQSPGPSDFGSTPFPINDMSDEENEDDIVVLEVEEAALHATAVFNESPNNTEPTTTASDINTNVDTSCWCSCHATPDPAASGFLQSFSPRVVTNYVPSPPSTSSSDVQAQSFPVLVDAVPSQEMISLIPAFSSADYESSADSHRPRLALHTANSNAQVARRQGSVLSANSAATFYPTLTPFRGALNPAVLSFVPTALAPDVAPRSARVRDRSIMSSIHAPANRRRAGI